MDDEELKKKQLRMFGTIDKIGAILVENGVSGSEALALLSFMITAIVMSSESKELTDEEIIEGVGISIKLLIPAVREFHTKVVVQGETIH